MYHIEVNRYEEKRKLSTTRWNWWESSTKADLKEIYIVIPEICCILCRSAILVSDFYFFDFNCLKLTHGSLRDSRSTNEISSFCSSRTYSKMQSGITIMGQANANYRYSDFFFFYRTKIKEKKSNCTEVKMLKNDF